MRARTAIAALTASITVGCAGTLQDASSGLVGCASRDITISDDNMSWSTHTWTASCNERRFYCSSASTGRYSAQIACTPDTQEAAAHATAEASLASGPDPTGTWRASVMDTGFTRVRTSIVRCISSSHIPAEIRARVDQEGRIVDPQFDAQLTDTERQCAQQALATVDLNGSVEHARDVTLTIRAGAMDVVAAAEAAPPTTSGGATTSVDADPRIAIRAAIDARAATVLACTDGAPVAISAAWSEAGDVTLALTGRSAGSAIEECVRSAVGPLHVEAGAAGSLLYPVAAR